MAIGPSIPSEVGVFRKNIVRRKNIRGFDVLSFWRHFRPKLLLKSAQTVIKKMCEPALVLVT